MSPLKYNYSRECLSLLDYSIEIHPLKWLYYNLDSDQRSAGAIIASSYDVREDKLSELKSKLILSFNDIIDCNNSFSFNPKLASEIYSYVRNLPSDTEVMYVCCDSGESRSSAIAAALMRFRSKDDMVIWSDPHYHPNTLVYKLLCNELGVSVTDKEIREKVLLNEAALKTAIFNARKHENE